MYRFPILLAAALALAVPAGADECVMTTSEPEVAFDSVLFGRQYVDNDLCQFDEPEEDNGGGGYGGGNGGPCLFSVWFYTESNDVEGLQRVDEVVDDTCGGRFPGDTLTFF